MVFAIAESYRGKVVDRKLRSVVLCGGIDLSGLVHLSSLLQALRVAGSNPMNVDFDEQLRLIHNELVLYEPWLIPSKAFGEDEVTGIVNGQYVTLKKKRGFRLRTCWCVITCACQMGSCCSFCLQAAIEQNLPFPEWISLVCAKCVRRCEAPFCSTKGLCPNHAAKHPADGKWYCPVDFDKADTESLLANVEAQHGRLASSSAGLLASCFFDDKRLLE